jgi:hypothetical protein
MEKTSNAYKILVRKPHAKRPVERTRHTQCLMYINRQPDTSLLTYSHVNQMEINVKVVETSQSFLGVGRNSKPNYYHRQIS